MSDKPEKMVSDIQLGIPKLYSNSVGDTWDPAWAADGNLYFPGNDGSGWDQSCSSNVFFSRVTGDDIYDLQGETLNCLAEYDGWAKKGPDGCTWKTTGCTAVNGTLYFSVARHNYGTDSGDPFRRQTAGRASIVKSADLGKTWVRSASKNYDSPMFPDLHFATPYFIHYGQDGSAPAVDNADIYIYAISNNGFWCNGDSYILGRVKRSKLSRLNANDWEFYTGGNGMLSECWSSNADHAALIIDNPRKCGETGATYLAALGRYILVSWYYPGDPNVETDETRLIFYEAPHPWGPWQQFKEVACRPYGWYCPRVLAKWQVKCGKGEVEAVMVTGGDYYESQYYRFTVVPLKIKAGGKYPSPPAERIPLIINDDQIGQAQFEIEYIGDWKQDLTRQKAFGGSEHLAAIKDAEFILRFAGRRLRWYTSKENRFGIASVSLDGTGEVDVDLYTYCVEPQFGRFVFDSGDLSSGNHYFTVRVSGRKNDRSSGYSISNDRIEIMRS